MILWYCNSPQLHLYFHQVPWKAKLPELFVPRCGLKFDSGIGLEDFFFVERKQVGEFLWKLPVTSLFAQHHGGSFGSFDPRIKHHGLKWRSLSFFCCWVFGMYHPMGSHVCLCVCVYVSQVLTPESHQKVHGLFSSDILTRSRGLNLEVSANDPLKVKTS